MTLPKIKHIFVHIEAQ